MYVVSCYIVVEVVVMNDFCGCVIVFSVVIVVGVLLLIMFLVIGVIGMLSLLMVLIVVFSVGWGFICG